MMKRHYALAVLAALAARRMPMACASASLARDCQPSPVARYAATTSASMRRDTRSFGVASFGRPRPRFIAANTSGMTSRIGLARAKSASVGSKVTVIEMLDQIAGKADLELVKILQKNFVKKNYYNPKLPQKIN